MTLTSAAVSFAGVTFSLDHEYWSVVKGGSVTITGRISTTAPDYMTFGGVEQPTNGIDTLTGISFPQSLIDYTQTHVSGEYVGDLFTLSVPLTASVGMYDMSLAPGGSSSRSEMYVQEHLGTKYYRNYGIEVLPVPEPATLAALGLGAVQLFRRRRVRG